MISWHDAQYVRSHATFKQIVQDNKLPLTPQIVIHAIVCITAHIESKTENRIV